MGSNFNPLREVRLARDFSLVSVCPWKASSGPETNRAFETLRRACTSPRAIVTTPCNIAARGRSGIKLPAISLGLWHNFGGVDNFENSRAMLRRAFDLGITHFDLANNYGPPYGSAEETSGRC